MSIDLGVTNKMLVNSHLASEFTNAESTNKKNCVPHLAGNTSNLVIFRHL